MGLTAQLKGYRLVNTKYPAIAIFDDVADPEEFEALYALQALTNPRLKDQVGDVALIEPEEIPFQCKRNRSYAVAPFTHINPQGGRFNDGLFGALYIGSDENTAALEVKYHQQKYWSSIDGLAYDRFLFRGLVVKAKPETTHVVKKTDAAVLDHEDYSASQQLARDLKKEKIHCIQYPSVRNAKGTCWTLLTPKPVTDIVQGYLLEMIWNGKSISELNVVSTISA